MGLCIIVISCAELYCTEKRRVGLKVILHCVGITPYSVEMSLPGTLEAGFDFTFLLLPVPVKNTNRFCSVRSN